MIRERAELKISQHPCEGVIDKKWGEVVTDQRLIKRLRECFAIDVFRIKYPFYLRVAVGSSFVSLTFNSHFFHTPEFFRAGHSHLTLSKIKK